MRSAEGARQKLARASFHLDTLHQAFKRFRDSNPYELIEHVITENDATYGVVTVERAKTIPDDFALITGDFCNNLRSVLDYILWELLPSSKVALQRPPAFPIFDDSDGFAKSEAARHLKQLLGGEFAFVEWAQPYNRGNDLLQVLRHLNDTDKHRAIVIVTQIASFDTVRLPGELFVTQPGEQPTGIFLADKQRVEGGTELVRFPIQKWPTGEDVQMQATFRFEFVFGDIPRIAESRNVGGVLTEIRDEVENIFNHFVNLP